MELVVAVTLYLTFFAFLLLPTLGAPAIFGRMAIGLCASELVAAVGWGFTQQSCGYGHCPALTGTFESAASLQIPVLAALMFALATGYGVFVARRW